MSNFNNKVAEHLENNIFYHGGRKVKKPLVRESDKRLVEYVNKDTKSILDFGGGTGRFLDILKNENKMEGIDYYIYDSSEDMLQIAKNKFPDLKDNISSDLDLFKNNNFDIVFVIDVLQHSENIDQVKETIKVAVPLGKKVIFHFWLAPKTRQNKVRVHGQEIPEIFLSRNDVNSIIKDLNLKCTTQTFNQLPYDCVILSVDNTKFNFQIPKLEKFSNELKEAPADGIVKNSIPMKTENQKAGDKK